MISDTTKAELTEFEKLVGISYKTFLDTENLLNDYTACMLLDAFQRMKVFKQANKTYLKQDLLEKIGVIPTQYRQFNALLDILETRGFIHQNVSQIVSTQKVADKEVQQKIAFYKPSKGIISFDTKVLNFIGATTKLADVCFKDIPELLTGEKTYIDVMFPQGDMSMVANIYKGTIQTYLNKLVSEKVQNVIERQQALCPTKIIQILEIGAGTGGTTRPILEAIAKFGDSINYWYTDLGAGFTRVGRREFGDRYPFTKFKVLDISKQPSDQGFTPQSIDLIICNNVLHATRSIQECLINTTSLLRDSGILIINDITQKLDFNTVTFGFTREWWNFEDIELRLPHSPALNNTRWRTLLNQLEYDTINIEGIPIMPVEQLHQSIITARKNERKNV